MSTGVSDDSYRALIEEARRAYTRGTMGEQLYVFPRLLSTLEASEAQRQELADKIRALAEWEGYILPGRVVRELRALVSGDNKEQP